MLVERKSKPTEPKPMSLPLITYLRIDYFGFESFRGNFIINDPYRFCSQSLSFFSVNFDVRHYFLKYKLIYFVSDDDLTSGDLTEKMTSHFKILWKRTLIIGIRCVCDFWCVRQGGYACVLFINICCIWGSTGNHGHHVYKWGSRMNIYALTVPLIKTKMSSIYQEKRWCWWKLSKLYWCWTSLNIPF